MPQRKVIIIGPAHPLRGGGLASFNERLAKAFMANGDDVTIYTFSLQYPSFLFPGSTQYSTEPAPKDLKIKVAINSINPLNWIKVGNQIKNENADLVVVRYWLPFMGPALGTILRRIKKNKHSKIVCIADNIIPHETRPGDKAFTKYFVKPVDGFVTMSNSVMKDLKKFSQQPAVLVMHPLYDNFGNKVDKRVAREHLKLDTDEKIMLFFGFIRHYKGLDILLHALKVLKDKAASDPQFIMPKLLIAGEFYDDRKKYDELIEELQIKNLIYDHTHFISDSEVKYFLCAADVVIQPYRDATQSGVTPLAYHFDVPMIVTNVGALPDFVPHGKVGFVTTPEPNAIANSILEFFENDASTFIKGMQEEKKKYDWQVMVDELWRISKA